MLFEIYFLLHVATAFLALLVALYAFRHSGEPGAIPLAWMLVAVAIWAFGSALEINTISITEKILWAKVEYFGISTAPVCYFLFALEYNRLGQLLSGKRILLLFFVPALTVGLVWTNEFHHLIWTHFTSSTLGSHFLVFEHGIGFWVGGMLYSYIMVSIATVLLLWMAIRIPAAFRNRAILIIVGVLFPLSTNLIYLLGVPSFPGLDITPVTFALSGILCALFVLRNHLFDLLPIARDILLTTLPDGIIILDKQKRLMDINPAARKMLGIATDHDYGKQASEVFPDWPDWERRMSSGAITEFSPVRNPSLLLENHFSLLKDRDGIFHGYLYVLRDITRRKQAQVDLHDANLLLQNQLDENRQLQASLRDQAIRDPLTGLYNRRYLMETMEREIARASRSDTPLSVAILDIDHFKTINDELGHGVGDEVLRTLGEILHLFTRKGDIACRYGGDEFVILMPGALISIARSRVMEWMQEFRIRTTDADQYPGTFSCGLAGFPKHGSSAEDLLKAADLALYEAKNAGRDRIVTAN